AHTADALICLEIRPSPEQPLEAQEHTRESPTTRDATVLDASVSLARSPDMIPGHPWDSVALFFCMQGESFYCDENGSQILHAGQMLACNADTTFIRGFGVGVSEMVLTVSMEEFTKASGGESLTDAKKFTFGRSPDTQPRIAAATRLAQCVDNALNATDHPAGIFEEECLSWIETLFQGTGRDSAQLFEQAQHFINVHLSSPDLRRTDIASALHVSQRQV